MESEDGVEAGFGENPADAPSYSRGRQRYWLLSSILTAIFDKHECEKCFGRCSKCMNDLTILS